MKLALKKLCNLPDDYPTNPSAMLSAKVTTVMVSTCHRSKSAGRPTTTCRSLAATRSPRLSGPHGCERTRRRSAESWCASSSKWAIGAQRATRCALACNQYTMNDTILYIAFDSEYTLRTRTVVAPNGDTKAERYNHILSYQLYGLNGDREWEDFT